MLKLEENNSQLEFATFRMRLGAFLIDILIIIIFPIFFLPNLLFEILSLNLESNLFILLFISGYILVFPFIGLIYRILFDSSKYQGTPGKIISGINVVDHNLKRISFKKSLLRNFMKFFSGLFFYLGYLTALQNDKCLTWHDIVAKTYVIRKKNKIKF